LREAFYIRLIQRHFRKKSGALQSFATGPRGAGFGKKERRVKAIPKGRLSRIGLERWQGDESSEKSRKKRLYGAIGRG
jgi:hypothetical protein